MLVAVVFVIVIAGVGTYVFVFAPGAARTSSTTILVNTSHTSTGTTFSSTASTAKTSSSGNPTYYGTFTYITPLGPFGINDSTGKPVQWNSTQAVSGNFTFSIDPSTYMGQGTGQGSITVATRGYCTGSQTVSYTFTISAFHLPGEDYLITFNTPTPGSVTVNLTCQGSTVGFNAANNPVGFLSVYPNELSPASLPSTSSQEPTAGISYSVTITQAS